jgi:TolB-like protein/lipopolysaccharide biosynthesis regulator YciM
VSLHQKNSDGQTLSLFTELRRRNVFKVAAAYIVFAWLVMQVADVVLNNFDAPAWAFRILTLLLALGLPLAVFFAWAFEITPDGVRREQDERRPDDGGARAGRKLAFVVLSLASFAIFFFAADRIMDGSQSTTPVVVSTEAPDMSIAVLPFRNRSALDEDVYFVDGIHDDILTQLANISVFEKVISRTSMEQYRDTTKPMLQIGRELGVATILEGGVQRAGDRVRINMQLIDAASDKHLWAQTYDRELTVQNIFAIQSEISREIVEALQAALTEQDDARLRTVPTDNLEAYDEYVRGRYEMAKRSVEALDRAITHFEKAIELDPEYALAYVGLADAINIHAFQSRRNWRETAAARQAAIEKALELDPLSGEAYTSLADLRKVQGRTDEAKQLFEKAIELSPNYATAYQWYSHIFAYEGDSETALKYISRAVELDPMAPILRINMIDNLRRLRRHEEAMQEIYSGIERHPDFPIFYAYLSGSLTGQGRIAEALRATREARRLSPGQPGFALTECELVLELGDDEAAERCFVSLRERFPHFVPLAGAQVYRFRHEFDKALEILIEAMPADPGDNDRRVLAWTYMDAGMFDEARPIVRALFPRFFGENEITVEYRELFDALQAAIILQSEGRQDPADELYDQMLALMREADRLNDGYGAIDASIHALRGHKQLALSTMREAIDAGWRQSWWAFRLHYFDAMKDEPEWNAMMAELEADIDRQRAWYDAHRDEPIEHIVRAGRDRGAS